VGAWRGNCWDSKVDLARLMKAVPLGFVVSLAVQAAPFDCRTDACGLPGDGPFLDLVVGTVTSVADDSAAQRVFAWAREHDYWKSLQPDPRLFVESIQVMSIEIPGPQGQREITLLMGREHYEAIKIAAGDLVRYTPHPSGHAGPNLKDPVADAYWTLFGCIAVLCRAEDRSCPSRYAPGVYRLADGAELGVDLRTPVADGLRIDIGTYQPLRAVGQ